MHWILLMSLAFLMLGRAGAGEPKHIPRFAFDRHESPLNLPLTLRVGCLPPPLSDSSLWLTSHVTMWVVLRDGTPPVSGALLPYIAEPRQRCRKLGVLHRAEPVGRLTTVRATRYTLCRW